VDETTYFWCNECSAIVSNEDFARIVIQMETCQDTCPQCGRVVKAFHKEFAILHRPARQESDGCALRGVRAVEEEDEWTL